MTALLLGLMMMGSCSDGKSQQNSAPDVREEHHDANKGRVVQIKAVSKVESTRLLERLLFLYTWK